MKCVCVASRSNELPVVTSKSQQHQARRRSANAFRIVDYWRHFATRSISQSRRVAKTLGLDENLKKKQKQTAYFIPRLFFSSLCNNEWDWQMFVVISLLFYFVSRKEEKKNERKMFSSFLFFSSLNLKPLLRSKKKARRTITFFSFFFHVTRFTPFRVHHDCCFFFCWFRETFECWNENKKTGGHLGISKWRIVFTSLRRRVLRGDWIPPLFLIFLHRVFSLFSQLEFIAPSSSLTSWEESERDAKSFYRPALLIWKAL